MEWQTRTERQSGFCENAGSVLQSVQNETEQFYENSTFTQDLRIFHQTPRYSRYLRTSHTAHESIFSLQIKTTEQLLGRKV